MFIYGVVVIHVELHHRHDLAESRHEFAEKTGFIHSPQNVFRTIGSGEDFQENPVGFRVSAQFPVHQPERLVDQGKRIGMKIQIVLVSQLEQPEQIDRVPVEYIKVSDGDAAVVDQEVVFTAYLLLASGYRVDQPVETLN